MATTTSTGGWPDATNTGVPAGTTLTPSGALVINTAGAVIQGLDISGGVVINAPNVTLLNCKITSSGFDVVQIKDGITGTVVQNCDIDNLGAGGQGIAGQGTFIANNIHGCADGIDVRGDNTVIQDNYIHNMTGTADSHFDGIQADGGFSNLLIQHNTVVNENGQTSAVMLDNYWGPIDQVSINNNLLIGGGYTVYINEMASGQPGGGPVTNVSFTNNHLGGGYWGDLDLRTQLGDQPTISGNVDDGTTLLKLLNTSANVGSTTTSTAPGAPVIASFSTDTGVVGDGITSDNTLALKGTAAAGSTVKVYDGSTQIGTATADSTGAWNYITSVLTDAKHALTATATDASGQTSAASSVLSVTVDTKAPTAPVLVSDSIVNTNHVVLSGTAEANSSVKVYDGTTVVGTGTTTSTGTWSITTGALTDGAHALTATATDVAGNVSAMSAPLDPVIGSTTTTTGSTTGSTGATAPAAPAIASFSTDSGVVGDHITNDNTLTLTGTAVASSTVKVFDGTTQVGTATANSSGQWSVTTAALNDGGHTLTATDTDSSGHTSAASTALSVTIDTHAPTAPTMAVYSQTGTAVGSATTLTDLILKGTAEANSTVKVFDGTTQIGSVTANGSGAWSLDTGHLANGSHSFSSTDTDVAGNTSTASTAKGVSVTAPTAPIEFTNLSESSHIATIKGTADAYSQIKLYEGNTALGTVETGADGTWSFTTGYMSNKVHTFTAQELDSSGATVAKSSGEAILGSTRCNTLTSTSGDDLFFGNGHPDTFVFASNFGHDVIKDFVAGGRGHDTIQFSTSQFDSFASVLSHASQVGQDVVIATGNDTLTLKNVSLTALNGHDFHFA